MEASKQKEWPLLLDAPFILVQQLLLQQTRETLLYLRPVKEKARDISSCARTFLISHTRTQHFSLNIYFFFVFQCLYSRFFILFHFLSSSFLALDLNQTQYFIPNGNWSLSINTRRGRGGGGEEEKVVLWDGKVMHLSSGDWFLTTSLFLSKRLARHAQP